MPSPPPDTPASPPVPGSLVLRYARPEDEEGVVAMGDVFDGLDYVQHLYRHYMDNQNFHCFVAELKGKIVAFRYYLILDEGKRVVGGGLRVHPDHRRQHLPQRISEFGACEVIKLYPKIFENYVFTAFDSPFQRRRLKEFPQRYNLITTRRLCSIKAPMEQIKSCLAETNPITREHLASVQHPSKRDLLQHLQTPDTKATLFPDKNIIVLWEPYELSPANLNYIYDTSYVIWSMGKGYEEETVRVSLLTVVSAIPCQAGIRLDLEVYGKEQKFLSSHILTAVQYVRDTYPKFQGSVEMVLYFPEDFNLQESDTLSQDIMWEKGAWSRYEKYLLASLDMEATGGEAEGKGQSML